MKDAYHHWLRAPFQGVLKKYHAHSARERRLIALLGAMICGIGVFYAIYLPALSGLRDAEGAYSSQRELLEWMQANASRVKNMAAAPAKAGTKEPLPALLADTAKNDGIAIRRLEVDKDGMARLTLEKTPFNQLISWLDRLTNEDHAQLVSLTVTRTGTPGVVDAYLKISE
jgi:general secretion pathway protein M